MNDFVVESSRNVLELLWPSLARHLSQDLSPHSIGPVLVPDVEERFFAFAAFFVREFVELEKWLVVGKRRHHDVLESPNPFSDRPMTEASFDRHVDGMTLGVRASERFIVVCRGPFGIVPCWADRYLAHW